jgi:AraC-like DNA-binding protein
MVPMGPTPWLPLLDAALRGALLALLILLGTTLWRTRSRLPSARLGWVLMLGLAVQTVSSWPAFDHQVPAAWQVPLVAISVGNALLFWLLVRALFEDDFTLTPWHAALWVAIAAVGAATCWVGGSPALRATAAGAGLLRLTPWVPVLFAVLAVVAAARQAGADLVERRRRLRVFIFAFGAVYTLAIASVRLGTGQGRLGEVAAFFDSAGLLLCVALAAAQLLRVSGDSLLIGLPAPDPMVNRASPAGAPVLTAPTGSSVQVESTTPSAVTATAAGDVASTQATLTRFPLVASTTEPVNPDFDRAEVRLEQDLQRLMGTEHFYRTEGLTLDLLARQLKVPEYRLRRHINQRLGHRNFNAYINGLRLVEAQAALADPAQRHLPVLTIALTAGFGSIGPFNRAFKAATSLTPTEFRQRSGA